MQLEQVELLLLAVMEVEVMGEFIHQIQVQQQEQLTQVAEVVVVQEVLQIIVQQVEKELLY